MTDIDDGSDAAVGRAAMRGAMLGFILAAPAFALVALLSGAEAGGAIAVGVFVGLWGGCGWGGMLAATRCLANAEDHASASGRPAKGERP